MQAIAITNCLRNVTKQYNSIIIGKAFDYNDRKKSVEALSPIIFELKKQAESKIKLCEKEIASNNDKQVAALDKRSELYDKLNSQKGKMSELDTERIKISAEIVQLTQEISEHTAQISKLQEKIAKEKSDKKYWDTVFYATCWIPFANIGTGVKKHVETGQYEAAAKVLGKDIVAKQSRIGELNDKCRMISDKQAKCNESSSELANLITAVEGEVSVITTFINDLRAEMILWQTVLAACSEVDAELQYADGKIEKVIECFERLAKISELIIQSATDKYIEICLCRGDVLPIGQKLRQNEYLLSQNRRFVAVMQSDNNFVVYNSERPIWSSGTWGAQGNGYVELNPEGLVSLKGTNKSWNTKRGGAVVLIMQDDGNLVAYDKNGNPLWASDTYTYANVPGICFRG